MVSAIIFCKCISLFIKGTVHGVQKNQADLPYPVMFQFLPPHSSPAQESAIILFFQQDKCQPV